MMRMITTIFLSLAVVVSGAVLSPAHAEEKVDVQKPGPKAMTSPAVEQPFTLEAELGLGYDSNAYLAPDTGYNDPAQGGAFQPTVIHSGFFIPVLFKGRYTPAPDGSHRFITSFRFNGDIYPSSELSNADTFKSEIAAGLEFILQQKDKREDAFSIGPFITYNRETYFDRDTGVDKTTQILGTNISNRYNYRGFGLEAGYKKRTTDIQYGVHGKVEQRDYDDVAVAQYDHTYYVFGGDMEIPVARPTKLKLSYDYKVRDYDERHARDANGVYSNTNPFLQYTYHDFGATLRNRLGKRFIVYIDYDRLIRNDENVGYNDYTEDEYRIRIMTREERGNKVRAELSYWKRDYPNAFAFDVSGQTQKKYDGLEATLKGELGLGKNWGLWGEYKYWNQDSTDLRYDYDRYQVIAGVKWER